MNPYLDLQSPAEQEAGKLASVYGLQNHGLTNLQRVYWNLPTAALYEESIFRGEGSMSHLGPLVVDTGKHTARAAADKFVVREQSTEDHIWWGKYNRPFTAKVSARCWRGCRDSCKAATCSCRTATPAPIRSIVCPSGSLRRRHGTACSRATCS